jgi:hypothetical protein
VNFNEVEIVTLEVIERVRFFKEKIYLVPVVQGLCDGCFFYS